MSQRRKAEDGVIDASYSLIETDSTDYLVRTQLNVRDSDATLILYAGILGGGTKQTYEYADKTGKPVLLIDITNKPDLKTVIDWILENNISVLNIAGPRESKNPGIYVKSKKIISELIKSQLSR